MTQIEYSRQKTLSERPRKCPFLVPSFINKNIGCSRGMTYRTFAEKKHFRTDFKLSLAIQLLLNKY